MAIIVPVFCLVFRRESRPLAKRFAAVLLCGAVYLAWFYWPRTNLLDEETCTVYEVDFLSADGVKPDELMSKDLIRFFNSRKMVRSAWKTVFSHDMQITTNGTSDGAFVYFVEDGNYDLRNIVAACLEADSKMSFLRKEGQVYYILPDQDNTLYHSVELILDNGIELQSSIAEYKPSSQTISANTYTYYAIKQDHTLYGWGERYPNSPDLENATPILENAVYVDAGWRGCLAVDAQGRLWSVGEYLIDQLGPEPQLVMDNIADVSAGLNHFICLTADGDVYVCGRNSGYQLTGAVEVDEVSQYSPPVCIMSGVKAISASDDGCCVLADNGDLFFWGTFIEFTSPEPVLVGRGFDDLPSGMWAVKGTDLYAIEEAKTLTGRKLTTEKILEGVSEVYAGIVRTSDGRFLAADTEIRTFQEISLPEDITYACFSDQLLIQRKDGTIERAAADEDLLDVAAAMRTVSAGDFLNPDDYGNVSAQQLAAALNEAADHQTDPSEVAPDGFFNAEWSIWNIYLEDGSDTWQYDDLRLSVSCGLNENIVEAALCKDGKRDTAYFKAETLYQLVRHSCDYEEIIDEAAYKRFESILKTEMDETFEAMSEAGNFTGYQLTRFVQEWEFEDPDGCMIEVYDFRFALLTDEPENVSWAGGMYLDGDLRVQGFVRGGRFVVRYHGEEIAATAFMGSDFYYHPGDPDEDRAKEEIISALSYKADSERGD